MRNGEGKVKGVPPKPHTVRSEFCVNGKGVPRARIPGLDGGQEAGARLGGIYWATPVMSKGRSRGMDPGESEGVVTCTLAQPLPGYGVVLD